MKTYALHSTKANHGWFVVLETIIDNCGNKKRWKTFQCRYFFDWTWEENEETPIIVVAARNSYFDHFAWSLRKRTEWPLLYEITSLLSESVVQIFCCDFLKKHSLVCLLFIVSISKLSGTPSMFYIPSRDFLFFLTCWKNFCSFCLFSNSAAGYKATRITTQRWNEALAV